MDLALEIITSSICRLFIDSPTHLLMLCFLSIYYVPGTVIGAAVSRVSRQALPWGTLSLVAKLYTDEQSHW